jgi:hypothetical protein
VLVTLLGLTPYTTRDPDSNLYAAISAQLAVRPVHDWIAPVWGGEWGNSGLFREHPAGIFLVAAMLAKTGYPAHRAAYAVNAVYQLLSIVLIQRLASRFMPRRQATVVACAVQLIPLAFSYRVRANHEQAILFGSLFALYCVEFLPRWFAALGVAVATVLVTLVKGVFVVFVPVAMLMWGRLRGYGSERGRQRIATWQAVVVSIVITLLIAAAYEHLYQARTGDSFLRVYLGRQLGSAAEQKSAFVVPMKTYNAFWYLTRVVWFTFPWSITFGIALVRRFDDVVVLVRRIRTGSVGLSRREQALVFSIVLAVVYIGLFALSDRKQERYIFTAYYAVTIAGAALALQTSHRVRELATRVHLDRPFAPVIVWLAAALLKLAVGYYLPRIKIWTG